MKDRLLRLPSVLDHLGGISKSQFYAGIKQGIFPPPKKLGPRTSVWPESSIQAVIERVKSEGV